MRRTFGFDVLACPRCGGRLRLIALIEQVSVIQRILRHLGAPTEIPAPRPARAPPLPFDARARPMGGDGLRSLLNQPAWCRPAGGAARSLFARLQTKNVWTLSAAGAIISAVSGGTGHRVLCRGAPRVRSKGPRVREGVFG